MSSGAFKAARESHGDSRVLRGGAWALALIPTQNTVLEFDLRLVLKRTAASSHNVKGRRWLFTTTCDRKPYQKHKDEVSHKKECTLDAK